MLYSDKGSLRGQYWKLPNGYWRAVNAEGKQCTFKLQVEAQRFAEKGLLKESKLNEDDGAACKVHGRKCGRFHSKNQCPGCDGSDNADWSQPLCQKCKDRADAIPLPKDMSQNAYANRRFDYMKTEAATDGNKYTNRAGKTSTLKSVTCPCGSTDLEPWGGNNFKCVECGKLKNYGPVKEAAKAGSQTYRVYRTDPINGPWCVVGKDDYIIRIFDKDYDYEGGFYTGNLNGAAAREERKAREFAAMKNKQEADKSVTKKENTIANEAAIIETIAFKSVKPYKIEKGKMVWCGEVRSAPPMKKSSQLYGQLFKVGTDEYKIIKGEYGQVTAESEMTYKASDFKKLGQYRVSSTRTVPCWGLKSELTEATDDDRERQDAKPKTRLKLSGKMTEPITNDSKLQRIAKDIAPDYSGPSDDNYVINKLEMRYQIYDDEADRTLEYVRQIWKNRKANRFNEAAPTKKIPHMASHFDRTDWGAMGKDLNAMVKDVQGAQERFLRSQGLTWERARALDARGRDELQKKWNQYRKANESVVKEDSLAVYTSGLPQRVFHRCKKCHKPFWSDKGPKGSVVKCPKCGTEKMLGEVVKTEANDAHDNAGKFASKGGSSVKPAEKKSGKMKKAWDATKKSVNTASDILGQMGADLFDPLY